MVSNAAYYKTLKHRVRNHEARIGILGLTADGLDAAVRYSRDGYTVICIDSRDFRVESVRRGISFSDSVPDIDLEELVSAGRIKATTNVSTVREVDFLLVFQEPAATQRRRALDIGSEFKAVSRHLKRGVIICLEQDGERQSCYDDMKGIMEAGGRVYGVDYLLGTFSMALKSGGVSLV